jgi:NAD(P)-dependent dehydrogenase (short-subunit alcohol dehydrogenase family)
VRSKLLPIECTRGARGNALIGLYARNRPFWDAGRILCKLEVASMDSLTTLFSLKGRVGLVTGASSGLGIEFARALALAGADVALVARRGEVLERVASELREHYGVKTAALAADITIDTELDRVLGQARSELGIVDVLVNNAGIAPTGRAERIKRETWDQALALNTTAPMMLAQRVARTLIENKRSGRIINITSIYAHAASAIYRMAAYAASKAALANLTRQLAVEWGRYGITVNAIAPGWFPTEMNVEGFAKSDNLARIEAFTPMGRVGRLEELRGALIFLASDAASYVTGSVVHVDGGYLAW